MTRQRVSGALESGKAVFEVNSLWYAGDVPGSRFDVESRRKQGPMYALQGSREIVWSVLVNWWSP